MTGSDAARYSGSDVPLGFHRLVASVMLVAWLSGTTVSALTAHAVGGTECDEAPITSHHDITHFEGVQRAAGDGHCAVCHFYRDLRTARAADASFVPQIAPLCVRAERPFSFAPTAASRYSSSRAPPTSPA